MAKKLARLGTSGAFCWSCCTRGEAGGAGTGSGSKGSTFPNQSDVSDQNAGRRDNLQTSAGTQDTSWRSPSARRESGRAARAGLECG